jgi:DNA (cytosine-5)-methyltransferase 1
MSKKKYTFIDLFAGCGGLSEGFLQTGRYEALAHVEWEMPMVNTLRHRLVQKWGHSEEEARKRVVCFDVQKTEELIKGNWSEETKNIYTEIYQILREHYQKSLSEDEQVLAVEWEPEDVDRY